MGHGAPQLSFEELEPAETPFSLAAGNRGHC